MSFAANYFGPIVDTEEHLRNDKRLRLYPFLLSFHKMCKNLCYLKLSILLMSSRNTPLGPQIYRFVPTPLVGGGIIYSNCVFFVQTILVDRYIHGREM